MPGRIKRLSSNLRCAILARVKTLTDKDNNIGDRYNEINKLMDRYSEIIRKLEIISVLNQGARIFDVPPIPGVLLSGITAIDLDSTPGSRGDQKITLLQQAKTCLNNINGELAAIAGPPIESDGTYPHIVKHNISHSIEDLSKELWDMQVLIRYAIADNCEYIID